MISSYGFYCMMLFLICVRFTGLRKGWSLPYNAHTVLLAPLSDSIPIMDKKCRHTLSSTADCPSSNCKLVSFVSKYAVNFGRMFSPMGCYVMFRCERYQQFVFSRCNYCIFQVSADSLTTVSYLLELILLRDNVMFSCKILSLRRVI